MPTPDFDPFRFDDLLTPAQRALRDQVRAYMERVVRPRINDYWERAEMARDLAMGLGKLPIPIIGGTLSGHGCAGLDNVSSGLVKYELCRVDGSVSTMFGVHSGLAISSIHLLGSEEQKQRWLPSMVAMERLGAFGLTEPERGSDAAHVQTTARRVGDYWVLNGQKRWIGNGTIADILIIWARDEGGRFGGFVLENPRELPGFQAETITGKIAKRAVHQAAITLTDVHIPARDRLAGCNSFRDLNAVLDYTRAGVAWEAVGLAAGCYEIALDYACKREQFGKPIAGYQLIQAKLVEMAAELSQMQLLVWRLAQLMDASQASAGQISLAKQSCAAKARGMAAQAREILGGNGILIENHAARLFTDAEATYTYEGTNEINLLIAGREITGISAFV